MDIYIYRNDIEQSKTQRNIIYSIIVRLYTWFAEVLILYKQVLTRRSFNNKIIIYVHVINHV